MDEKADQLKSSFSNRLQAAKEGVTQSIKRMSDNTKSLKSQISAQLDEVRNKINVTDSFKQQISTVKSARLEELNQFDGQLEASLNSW